MADEANRLRDAVRILREGGTIKIGDVRLGTHGKNELTVTGWTRYQSLENLTQTKALSELDEIKTIFLNMLGASPELLDFSDTKTVGYYLGQDYGQGAIGICKEIEGKVIWEVGL